MKAAFVTRACGSRAAQQPAAPSGDRSRRSTANGQCGQGESGRELRESGGEKCATVETKSEEGEENKEAGTATVPPAEPRRALSPSFLSVAATAVLCLPLSRPVPPQQKAPESGCNLHSSLPGLTTRLPPGEAQPHSLGAKIPSLED